MNRIKYMLVLTASSALHVGALGALSRHAVAPQARAVPIEVALLQRPQVPPPPAPAPLAPPRVPRKRPAPTADKAVPAPEKKDVPPPPVFGVTAASTSAATASTGIAVPVGNTLMKGPDSGPPAHDVKPNPAAAPATVRFTRLPQRVGECAPEYTDEARERSIQGTIRVEVEVLVDGRVGDVRVVSGLGHGLDATAIRAMKRCRFTPAQIAGKNAVARIIYTVRYLLAED